MPDPKRSPAPGRPTGPDGPRTARLHVRCTPDDLAAYQAAAGRAGVSLGEWVRGRLSERPTRDEWTAGFACALSIIEQQHSEEQVIRDAIRCIGGLEAVVAAGAEEIDIRYIRNALDRMAPYEEPAAAEKEHGE